MTDGQLEVRSTYPGRLFDKRKWTDDELSACSDLMRREMNEFWIR